MYPSNWPRVLLCWLFGVLAFMGLAFAVLFLFVLPFYERGSVTLGALGALNAAAGGLALHASRSMTLRNARLPRESPVFHEALELAFSASVALCALLLLVSVSLGAGLVSCGSMRAEAIRLFSAASLFQAVASTAVGMVMFLTVRSNFRCVATAAVHFAACLFLCLAFFVGSSC